MRDVRPTALKHGIAADIKHALRHPMRIFEIKEAKLLDLGAAPSGELLEVI